MGILVWLFFVPISIYSELQHDKKHIMWHLDIEAAIHPTLASFGFTYENLKAFKKQLKEALNARVQRQIDGNLLKISSLFKTQRNYEHWEHKKRGFCGWHELSVFVPSPTQTLLLPILNGFNYYLPLLGVNTPHPPFYFLHIKLWMKKKAKRRKKW